MADAPLLYALAGVMLVALGVHATIVRPHLVRKVLGVNVASVGVFMVLVATAARRDPPDPVPHAMVLTGIVVAVSATAVALALSLRVREATRRAELQDSDTGDP